LLLIADIIIWFWS